MGVTSLAGKYVENLIEKSNDEIKPIDLYQIRIAAIMHDVGHGPFSHLSEDIFSNLEPIKSIKNKTTFTAGGSDAKAHEVLSFFITNSQPMQEILGNIQSLYSEKFEETIDIKLICQTIVGAVKNKPKKYYQAIINGVVDADKLDYIQRDVYFTGLKMGIDIDRIFSGVELDDRPEYGRNVVMNVSSVHNVEQLLFNKILLHPSMYHHHKVRAASCMFKSLFEIMNDYHLDIDGLNFEKVTDFLEIDDSAFLHYQSKKEPLQSYLKNLIQRNLLKRALVISMKTVEGEEPSVKSGYKKFLQLQKDEDKIREIRQKIAIKVGVSEYDIWLDIPKSSSIREGPQYWVKIMKDMYEEFSNYIPFDFWLDAYQSIQYRAHVFCPPIDPLRKEVAKEAKKILQE